MSRVKPQVRAGNTGEDTRCPPPRNLLVAVIMAALLCVTAGSAYPVSPEDPTVERGLGYLHSCQKADGGFDEEGKESSPGTTDWSVMAIVAASEDCH